MAEGKSEILVIRAMGSIGKVVLAVGSRLGNPTFALFRDLAPFDPHKAKLLEGFKAAGVVLLRGDLNDRESLVEAIKQVDVMISTVGYEELADQSKILDIIREADNIKKKERSVLNILLGVFHAAFVSGDNVNFEIDPSVGAEATELHPEVKYVTVDEYLNQFL